jgi:rhamnulokinase
MERHDFLALDLGAESGRAILGRLESSRIITRELTRFPNGPIPVLGHLHWNIYNLFEEIKKGIKTCLEDAKVKPESLAVDTWGVDFGLVAEDGSILSLPHSYRDIRTEGAMEQFFSRIPREKVYELTGIQFLVFNTLFQVFSMVRDGSSLLASTSDLLFMPDLFTYLLTGERASEFTIASTSQLLDLRRSEWSELLFEALGIPPTIMQDVLAPGTVIGPLSQDITEEMGLDETLVVATASHDTAAAIAAIPAAGEDWAYISSGTWSLMGIETLQPIINRQALEANFTNEGGVGGTIRFLKNIAGLWLVQQCRKEWSGGSALGYEELTRMAGEAAPFKALIDPDWKDFLNPVSMPAAIRRYCHRTGQAVPGTPPETVRCILESLALKYRFTLDQLRRLTPVEIGKIHVIGGGARNGLLCQFTADATGLPVMAGPAEATAIGNILVQAHALGYVRSLSDIRSIVRNSVNVKTFEPARTGDWETAYVRYQNLLGETGK